MNSDDWEYPIWALMNQHAIKSDWKIEHILIDELVELMKEEENLLPEYLIISRDDYHGLEIIGSYLHIFESDYLQVMKLKE